MVHSRTLAQTVTIPYYANRVCNTFGLDSLEHCLDKTHYKSYPDNIVYKFNSMGYRTDETFRGDEILAIGDSFTLGLGVNVEDTWPAQLSKLLNYPVLNFSLNGASNDWIARRSTELLDFFKPKALVVHYTFSHRRERPFLDWHDDERTECEPIYTDEQNLTNWRENFEKINKLEVPVVHSFIPNWHTSLVCDSGTNVLMPTMQVDYARDRFHYGPTTHSQLAEQIADIILNTK
jgi:hypothetical protein